MPPGPIPSDAIISIRPEFAELILEGKKTVELRRRIPSLAVGTRLWIYATLPVGAVIGTVTVHGIARGAKGKIWKEWSSETGVTRKEYDDYFCGAPEAVALLLKNARRIQPVPIDELRGVRRGFHPPQVMVHITPSEAKSLRTLGRMAA